MLYKKPDEAGVLFSGKDKDKKKRQGGRETSVSGLEENKPR